jgi:AhpD family alkylhydroperoxidase
MALAIAIAAYCDDCIGFYMRSLVRLGITREKLLETLSVVIYVRGGHIIHMLQMP